MGKSVSKSHKMNLCGSFHTPSVYRMPQDCNTALHFIEKKTEVTID